MRKGGKMIKFDFVDVDKIKHELEELARADPLYQPRAYRIFWTIVRDNLSVDPFYTSRCEALELLKKMGKIKIRRFFGLR